MKLDYEIYTGLNVLIGLPVATLIWSVFVALIAGAEMVAWLLIAIVLLFWIYIPISLFLGWVVAKIVKDKHLTKNKKDVKETMFLGGIYSIPALIFGWFVLSMNGGDSEDTLPIVSLMLAAILSGMMTSWLFSFSLPNPLSE